MCYKWDDMAPKRDLKLALCQHPFDLEELTSSLLGQLWGAGVRTGGRITLPGCICQGKVTRFKPPFIHHYSILLHIDTPIPPCFSVWGSFIWEVWGGVLGVLFYWPFKSQCIGALLFFSIKNIANYKLFVVYFNFTLLLTKKPASLFGFPASVNAPFNPLCEQ